MEHCLRPLTLLFMALLWGACSSSEDGDPPMGGPGPFSFVYCSDRSGNFELYRRTGDVDTQLTDDPLVDSWWPRISPIDDTVLFYRSDVADRPMGTPGNNNYAFASLWMQDLNTGAAVERIPMGSNGWSTQGVADWSPDRTQIVMAAQSTLNGNRWHLFLTDPVGAMPVRISTRTSLYLDPAWSPDGSQIVCTAFPVGYSGIDLANLEIHVMNVDGTGEVRLTTDNFRDHDPYWSPGGSEIAFETDIDPTFFGVGRWALRGVSPTGANLRTIIEDSQINTLPQWSADGATLYFQRFVFGGPGGFRIARVPSATGSPVTYLTPGGAFDDTDIALFPTGTGRLADPLSPEGWEAGWEAIMDELDASESPR